MFSSGISSWAAAKRYGEMYGTRDMVLLFADTKIEDEDNYRFLHEAAENIGAPTVIISDGRTPWEVMNDVRLIGNTRQDPCSRVLKRSLLDKWRNKHCDPDMTEIVIGICFDEEHRIIRLRERVKPWRYVAPLCDKPWLSKKDTLAWAESEGIKPPRMYDMGFAHANCGGFCIKAGHATFRLLWKHFPERFAEHERQEEALRQVVGDHAILRDRRGGKTRPMTLREFRERLEKDDKDCNLHDFGGCACALD